jgi:uncharacterized sodium:solute symporter family permease YidK
MADKIFDRETLLDLTVNVIPLVILFAFIAIFLILSPFGFDSVLSSIQFAIMGAMFVALAILTYYSGKAISSAEKEMEGEGEIEPAEETDDEVEAA